MQDSRLIWMRSPTRDSDLDAGVTLRKAILRPMEGVFVTQSQWLFTVASSFRRSAHDLGALFPPFKHTHKPPLSTRLSHPLPLPLTILLTDSFFPLLIASYPLPAHLIPPFHNVSSYAVRLAVSVKALAISHIGHGCGRYSRREKHPLASEGKR